MDHDPDEGIRHIQRRYAAIRARPFTGAEAALFGRLGPTRPELVLARLMAIAPDPEALRARLQPPVSGATPNQYEPFIPSPALVCITAIMNEATSTILSGVDVQAPALTFGEFSERAVASVPYLRHMLAQNLPELVQEDRDTVVRLYSMLTGRLQDTLAASVRGTLGTQR